MRLREAVSELSCVLCAEQEAGGDDMNTEEVIKELKETRQWVATMHADAIAERKERQRLQEHVLSLEKKLLLLETYVENGWTV